jgi:hypothetical protein
MQRPSSNEVKCLYVLGLLTVMAVVGCQAGGWRVTPSPTPTLEPSLIDSSILTGLPCAAPCWYGLEIGRSTKSDILATAQTLSFIDPKGIAEEPYRDFDPSTATLIRLNCRQADGGTCAALVVVNDVLKEIALWPPPALTLGEVVAHLGPPDFVSLTPVQGTVTLCDVALIWKQRGILVAFWNDPYRQPPQKEQFRCQEMRDKGVRPNLSVKKINYKSPDDYMLVRAAEPGGGLPWPGFAQP